MVNRLLVPYLMEAVRMVERGKPTQRTRLFNVLTEWVYVPLNAGCCVYSKLNLSPQSLYLVSNRALVCGQKRIAEISACTSGILASANWTM